MKKKILFIVALVGSLLPLKAKAATEGITITCGSDSAVLASSHVECSITGTTNSAVSGVQFRLSSNDLATISNIRVASIWQGDGEDGNIGVYTDTNKTGTFDIATFTLTAKNVGGIANIYANDIIFSDASFNVHSYENVTRGVTVQTTPSNPTFKDMNFYKCVVNAYNGSIYPGLPYTANLTDEQLSSITELRCGGSSTSNENKIIDVSGIEKLTGLRNVDLSNQKIQRINLTKNTRLLSLDLSNNLLTDLNLGTNTSLTVLNINNNNIQNLDISNLKILQSLTALENHLNSLNILENSNLTRLELNKNVKVPLTRVKSDTFLIDSNHIIRNIPLNANPSTIRDIFYYKNKTYNYKLVNAQGITIEEKIGNNTSTSLDFKITTGTKYKITFGEYIEEYTIMVKGDVTGTGEVSISDVARLYQFYKKKVPMDEIYALAGDIDGDGTVQVNDIAKLYQFYKHKIDSLN